MTASRDLLPAAAVSYSSQRRLSCLRQRQGLRLPSPPRPQGPHSRRPRAGRKSSVSTWLHHFCLLHTAFTLPPHSPCSINIPPWHHPAVCVASSPPPYTTQHHHPKPTTPVHPKPSENAPKSSKPTETCTDGGEQNLVASGWQGHREVQRRGARGFQRTRGEPGEALRGSGQGKGMAATGEG